MFNEKEFEKVQAIFKEKGCFKDNWVTAGAFSGYSVGIIANEYFPYIVKGIEFYCDYEDIDGTISLGIDTEAGSNCMDTANLNLEERDWIPKEKLLDTVWEELVKEFDEYVLPVHSETVCYAKTRKGGFVFWEEDGEIAYRYKGVFTGKEINKYDGKGKTLMHFEVGKIRKFPTKDAAGFAHSGRTNSWGEKINLPKKYELVPWEKVREDILATFKGLVWSIDLNNI